MPLLQRTLRSSEKGRKVKALTMFDSDVECVPLSSSSSSKPKKITNRVPTRLMPLVATTLLLLLILLFFVFIRSQNEIFPKRIIIVAGLNNSGAGLVANLILSGMVPNGGGTELLGGILGGGNNHGAVIRDGIDPSEDFQNYRSQPVEIQVVSLPFYGRGGRRCGDSTGLVKTKGTESVLYPIPCQYSFISSLNIRKQCGISESVDASMNEGGYSYHQSSFFLNLTSHIQWYESRGVEVSLVVMTRDVTVLRESRLHKAQLENCPKEVFTREEEIVKQEESQGKNILINAVQYMQSKKNNDGENGYVDDIYRRMRKNVILISYESLMALPEIYMKTMYEGLGIVTTGNDNYDVEVPPLPLVDANRPYVKEIKDVKPLDTPKKHEKMSRPHQNNINKKPKKAQTTTK